jgi:hypothetical protein
MKFILAIIALLVGPCANSEVLGQMTAMGQVYVITSEACKTADGKDAKGWSLSYSYNSIGIANRSCYQKYNDNIWIWEFSGREYVFPASFFKLGKS